ncbi:hypothetical protein [Ruegeria atlantica]|uniref:hypothetical protein n=1 Tax=Ruegeria atlantica TaxID=81569 RepID=UPI002494C25B|nr:hypothetical protein [Ruegeria atlantica]
MFDSYYFSFQVRAEVQTQSALVRMVAQGAGRTIVGKDILGTSQADDVSAVPLASDLSWPVRMITFSTSNDIPGLQRSTNELKEY